ncbi:hypothetical protein [Nocardia altamirensis]|uniref:hypothetical protein n=1 Tax=Nocardia altamirensis TaxID=472158 RepID=UPI00114D04CB|nr:hypothetical protein [Nocardia altamirensis]
MALARGTDNLRGPESRTVPRADMAAAGEIAKEVRTLIRGWRSRAELMRWPGVMAFNVTSVLDAAAAATGHLDATIREILGGSPPDAAQVRSIAGGWPPIWVQQLNVAFEILQITAGERPLAGSELAKAAEFTNEVHDFVLTVIPGIGEVVLAFEAVSGYQVVGFRQLSATEQAWAAFGLILPRVLNPLVNVGVRAVVTTRRAIAVVLARLLPTVGAAQITRFSLGMAIGLRVLPPEAFVKFLKLLKLAGKLTSTQTSDINFFLARIDYGARLAQWLRIVEKRLGPGFKGVHELPRPKQVKLKDYEPEMMEALSKATGKRVVALPEVLPHDYEPLVAKLASEPKAKMPQVQGVKYPDFLWGNEFCELYKVETSNVEAALKYIAGKGKQASTLVVTADAKSTVNLVELVDARFWAWPQAGYVDRVVVLVGNGVKILDRPSRYFSLNPTAYAATRLMIGNPGKLIEAAEAIINEPEDPGKR